MPVRKMARLAAAGVAVLGLGGWGLIAVTNANADTTAEDNCWRNRPFGIGSEFIAKIDWCAVVNDSISIEKVECDQPSGFETCKTGIPIPVNKPNEPAAAQITISWPDTPYPEDFITVQVDATGYGAIVG